MTDTPRDLDGAAFDATVLAAVQRLIPAERVQLYLRDLDRDYSALADSAVTDTSLQSRAHRIVSTAGMLGLSRMSECARELENAARSRAGQREALLQCRSAAGDVLRFAMPALEASATEVRRHGQSAGMSTGAIEA